MTDVLPANWLPAALVFLAVTLGVVSLVFLGEWWRDQRQQREVRRQLRGLAEGPAAADVGGGTALFREQAAASLPWLEPVLEYFPHRRDLQHMLEQAKVGWSVGSFLLMSGGIALGLGLAGLVLRLPLIAATVMAAIGAAGPYFYIKRRKAKRLAAFEEQFPEAIDLLGRSIRAGHAFNTGLKVVSDESPDPIGEEFRQVFDEQKFGLPLEDSLLALADRVDLVDVRIFVTAILIQREVGGNLAEILDKIAYTIRERFTIQRQVRVYTAQGRLTGYLLAGLPIAVGFIIYLLNPGYMGLLFDETIGRAMLGMAFILQIVGFFVIRRIIDIDI